MLTPVTLPVNEVLYIGNPVDGTGTKSPDDVGGLFNCAGNG